METQKTSNSLSNLERRKIKVIQIGKEEVIVSLFADDMILYIENPKDASRKLLELVNGEKTASSISGAGKTEQLHVKE